MPAVQPKIKSTKPLMEKRRRARINDSLMQLKTLVLDALNKNNPRHSKLEKADILEMTVRYLRTIQRRQISASVNTDPAKLGKFRSGYAECINEVTRYMGANDKADNAPELRNQLVGHLANLGTSNQQTSQFTTTSQRQLQQFQYAPTVRHPQQQQLVIDQSSYTNVPRDTVTGNAMLPSVDSAATIPVQRTVSPIPEGATTDFALTTPVYSTHKVASLQDSPSYTHAPQSPTNTTQVIQHHDPADVAGSHSSGEITLVLPQQALPNGQLPTHFIPVYAQGPVVVSPTTNIQSTSQNTNFVSLPSPQTTSTFQTIDGSRRSVSPSSVPTARAMSPVIDVTCCSPLSFTSPAMTNTFAQTQTALSLASREHFTYNSNCEKATYPVYPGNHCVSKKEPMWRPW